MLGPFSPDLHARARVEVRPAEDLNGFVPLGVPDNRVLTAQARFVNACTGAELGRVTLKPLATQTISGLKLWGPDEGAGTATTTPTPVNFLMPSGLTGCPAGQDYVPISVQVLAAGRPDVDLATKTCTAIAATPQADCWDDATTIRAWGTVGDPPGDGGKILSGDTVLVGDVYLDGDGGSTGCAQDAYYARLDSAATSCTMTATAYLDFDKRYALGGTYTAKIDVGGTQYTMSGPTSTAGNWIATGIPEDVGLNNATIDWTWKYKGPGSFEGTDCSKGKGCEQGAGKSIIVHRARVTDQGSPFDVLTAVKLTSGPTGPGSPDHHSVKLTNAAGGAQYYNGYLGVGLKSTFAPGDFAVLRLRGPLGNYSIVCDPRFPSPSTTDMENSFYFGCTPPYSYNRFATDSYWWKDYSGDGDPECPSSGPSGWFQGPPYPNRPWQCVHVDTGGNGFGLTDGIALTTGNCQNPDIDDVALKVKCTGHNYQCNNPINLPGPTDDVDLNDPRVIKIYILPFNAFNNLAPGANSDLPVVDFAAFYVTGWKYNKAVDPCPGNDNAKLSNYPGVADKPAQVAGHFLQWVEPGGGAVDPNATCDLTQLKPCRAVLVR
jgi:hypothetical protein